MKIGDIVARKSYGKDLYFRVEDIKNDGEENIIMLKGISFRLEADAPESDLVVMSEKSVKEYCTRINAAIARKCPEVRKGKLMGHLS